MKDQLTEYEIYFPLSAPNHAAFLRKTKKLLVHSFGGVTVLTHDSLGTWKSEGYIYHDKIAVLKVISSKAATSEPILRKLKACLEKALGQKTLLILKKKLQIV